MRTRAAIFFGASWDATVSSPAKLRWSRNLKRDSRACRSTSKLARACCAGRSAQNEVEASEPRTAHIADRSNGILCNLCRPRFSHSPYESLGRIGSWCEDNIQRLEMRYRSSIESDFSVLVVLHREGRIETFKYRGSELICEACGPDFRTAMIHTTAAGLAPGELGHCPCL